MSNVNLFENKIPPFIGKKLTHDEWKQIKKSTNVWNDVYINTSESIISNLYNAKGCDYIQISDGYGLYYLGNDICGFDVPKFKIIQQIRIRIKIHSKNRNGY